MQIDVYSRNNYPRHASGQFFPLNGEIESGQVTSVWRS